MKRFNGICGILLLFPLIFESCKQDRYLEYDPGYTSLRFIYDFRGKDSLVYSFMLHPGVSEDVVEIPFRLIGMRTPLERKIGIRIIREKTTAKENRDFVIEEGRLRADSIHGKLRVRLKRTPALNTGDLVIGLCLDANEYFAAPPFDEATYRIIVTNRLTQPTGWPFNEYSRVKHEFVIKVTGIGTGYEKWSGQEKVYWTGVLNKALYNYNKEHPGAPLTDENGLQVTF